MSRPRSKIRRFTLEMVEDYIGDELLTKEIAEKYETNRMTLYRILKEFDVLHNHIEKTIKRYQILHKRAMASRQDPDAQHQVPSLGGN